MKRASFIYCIAIAIIGSMLVGSGGGFGVLDYLGIFTLLLGGACAGDIIKLTCKPDMVFASSTGGLIKEKFFWFAGIQMGGALLSTIIGGFLGTTISIVVSLIIIGIHLLLNSGDSSTSESTI